MPNDYYVLLTGGRNNAGDFLIKYRAKHLFEHFRKDRGIIDFNGWQPFDEERLRIVNGAKALILTGGPALQEKMRPRVYRLTSNIADIEVPIVTMGIGWYSAQGRWQDTHNYPVNSRSRELLERIANDGIKCSVRDYHTLNTLSTMGYDNYMMTGCPAYYSLDHLHTAVSIDSQPKKIGFSLGVSLKGSRRMETQMQQAIIHTKDVFSDAEIEVVFHHGIDETYRQSPGCNKQLFLAQNRFVSWLEKENIPYVDISGSAEKLTEYYSHCDLHIGYRIHAHIFMSSISKPSVMLNEDGRGKALSKVIGGVSLDAYKKVYSNKVVAGFQMLGMPFDNMVPAEGLVGDFLRVLRYEYEAGVRLGQTRDNINLHFDVMKKFLRQLP